MPSGCEPKRKRRRTCFSTRCASDFQSDFYSYRYFASEGWLPGYSFPRLPLSAYIPARRGKGSDEYLSRPRFIAISEFGPQALVYHEGSVYRVNRVMIPVSADIDPTTSDPVVTNSRRAVHPMRLPPSRAQRCEPRPLRALRRRPVAHGPRFTSAVPHDERVDPPAGQDQLQRRGTPAARLRDPHTLTVSPRSTAAPQSEPQLRYASWQRGRASRLRPHRDAHPHQRRVGTSPEPRRAGLPARPRARTMGSTTGRRRSATTTRSARG